MKMKQIHLTLFLCLLMAKAHSQLSGIINRYTAVSAIDTCTGKLSVQDTAGFRPGGAALLIQMQGATMNTSNSASFGSITNLNGAGRYERVQIKTVEANAVLVGARLLNGYDPAGKVQLVSIPAYAQASVTDTLRPKPWDGSTGGVLALEVSGTLTLNAPVDASGAGFRGGADYLAPSNGCYWLTPISGYVYGIDNWRGGRKAEGIVAPITGMELGRGPQSNGGGGGDDHNAGGGGGGNLVAGGTGGNNADPNPIGCSGYSPGIGGYGLSGAGRLFLGGGGGAGHANNLLRSAGGKGGGIVLIRAGAINGSSPAIYAKGNSAGNSLDDGAGGGGAGGSIRLDLSVPNPSLVLDARGGNGGGADNNHVDRCMGPGGGGAGGRILTNAVGGTFNQNGGTAGVTFNSTVSCNNTSNTGQAGQNGQAEVLSTMPQGTLENLPQIVQSPVNQEVCIGNTATFNLASNSGPWQYQWQLNAGSAWQDITGGVHYAGFNSAQLQVLDVLQPYEGLQFRCRVIRPGCTEVVSTVAVLHVLPLPTASFTSAVTASSAAFSNASTNVDGYLWDFGDGNSSTLPQPSHTYATEGVFTVTLTVWNECDTVTAQKTVQIFLAPVAGFSVPAETLGCGEVQVQFQDASSANTTTWSWSFPGGTPASSGQSSPSISYSSSGNYTARLIVSNMVGKDTFERNFHVTVYQLPSAAFDFTVQAGGKVHFTNLSQNGESYSWDFGDGSPQQSGLNVDHTYTSGGDFVVTLVVNSPCGISIYQEELNISLVKTEEPALAAQLRLFPNPAVEQVRVEWGNLENQVSGIQMFDTKGNLLFQSAAPNGNSLDITLNGLPAGIYQVVLFTELGRVSRLLVKV